MPQSNSPATAIQTALDSFFQSNYGGGLPIAWDGTVYNPTPGNPYLATKVAALSPNPMTPAAGGPSQWNGTYQVSVFYPTETGLSQCLTEADAIANLFPRGLALTVSGYSEKINIINPRIIPNVQMADWIMIPVQLDWTFIQA